MALLLKFAASVGMENQLEVVSLGKGQGPRAEEILKVNCTKSLAAEFASRYTGSNKGRRCLVSVKGRDGLSTP